MVKLGDGVKYHLQVIRKKRIVASSSAAAIEKKLHDFESDLCLQRSPAQVTQSCGMTFAHVSKTERVKGK